MPTDERTVCTFLNYQSKASDSWKSRGGRRPGPRSSDGEGTEPLLDLVQELRKTESMFVLVVWCLYSNKLLLTHWSQTQLWGNKALVRSPSAPW